MNILDKLLNDIKSKLPLKKKGKASDEESDEYEEEGTESEIREDVTDSTDISDFSGEEVEEEDEPGNKSLVHKLKSKFLSLKKGKAAASEDDEEEADDDEAAKKKKKSKIIQIVIGVMVVGFLLSDYILPPEEPTVAPADTSPKKMSPAQEARLKREAEAKKKAAEAGTTETTDTATENQPTEDTATTTPEEPAVDNTAVDSSVTDIATEPTTEPDTTPVDSTVDTTADTPVEDVPTEDTTTDSTITASPDDTVIDTNTGETSPDVGINNNTDSIDGSDVYGGTEDSMTDQILEDLEKQARTEAKPVVKKEYVAAPDYEYRGRGLVYNCTGKHWACVDAPSYKTCEDNSSSVKYLGKKTECYPFNVYETTRGCESVQNRMVSSSAKTNFCNE